MEFNALDWQSIPLKELFVHVIGGDWGKDEDFGEEDFVNVSCIRGSEFKNWKSDFGSTAVTRKIKSSSLVTRKLVLGDILIEISGGGPEQPVGRTVLITEKVLNNLPYPSVCTNFLRLARPSQHVNSAYLNYFLAKFYMSGEVVNYQGGSNNLRNLKFKEYETIEVPLPPPAEQKVIAEKLDTLLAQVDNTKARLERIPEILKRFRQSVLAAAVSGKLTEEWRKENAVPAVSFAHNKKLPVLEETDQYADSVNNWVWGRLGSIVDLINGDRGKNYPNQSEYVEVGVPFINTGHIDPDGTLSDERMNYISKEKYDNLGGGKTKSNDLVYCLRGATMGKTARVHYDLGAIASSLVIVRPRAEIERDFAYYFLISPQSKKLITEFDNGSAQPNLSAKSLACYPIQLPPKVEQVEIVRRVEELFAFADRIEHAAQAALSRVNNLTQSILAKAFRGELTADWRAANPELISVEKSAEALLARIKAERAKVKPKKTAK